MKVPYLAQSAVFSSTLFIAISPALADVLPGSVLPEQVSKALIQQQPKRVHAPAQYISKPQKEEVPGGPEAKKIKFQLNNIILIGNHMFTTAELRGIYKDKLGKVITVAELFQIVQNITNYYRNNGYIISRAILPPQHVKNGVVKVQIIEGFIDKVDVTGNPHGARCLVKKMGERISVCRPLSLKRMEKYLLLENEIPGTQVKAVLSPSKTTTGAADLTLVTDNKQLTGYLSYDNYGTRYIGPQQMTGNLGGTSLFASGDAAQLTITKTPRGQELTFGDFNYSLPIFDEGDHIIFGATRTGTHPLFVLEPVDVNGLTRNYYVNYAHPVIRTRSDSLTLQFALNFLNTNVTSFSDKLYTDVLRPIGIGVNYNFADSCAGSNSFYGDFRQGLPFFGTTSNTSPNARTSHPGGHGNFTKFDFAFSRLQGIAGPISANIVARGLYSFTTLLASEQFTFGGSQLGRGYDIAEFIGDDGIAGSLELRYDQPIGKLYLQSLQFYTFYDAGKIWNNRNPAGVPLIESGTSTGVGMRFYFMKHVSGNVMWTQVLTKQVAAEELIGQGKEPRVFFSIVGQL